ncbi:MAG: hypothetical protein DRP11_00945 [Candidatus Aenigmatarchaeota archaeon]|nr:MAG: hypothetical protein DRP11_00945 [Candidatus Aenigmarchaeota archaeon]
MDMKKVGEIFEFEVETYHLPEAVVREALSRTLEAVGKELSTHIKVEADWISFTERKKESKTYAVCRLLVYDDSHRGFLPSGGDVEIISAALAQLEAEFRELAALRRRLDVLRLGGGEAPESGEGAAGQSLLEELGLDVLFRK